MPVQFGFMVHTVHCCGLLLAYIRTRALAKFHFIYTLTEYVSDYKDDELNPCLTDIGVFKGGRDSGSEQIIRIRVDCMTFVKILKSWALHTK